MTKCELENKSERRGILCRLVNRVDDISTQNALLWGLAWLIISTIAGWYLCVMPMSVVGYDVVGYMSLWWHLMLNLMVWIIPSSVLYVIILFHSRAAKVTDCYARLLFAHWPATLLLLPVVVIGKVKYAIFSNDFMQLLRGDALEAVLMALFCVVIVVWMLYWSYVAFRRGAGRGDWTTWSSFIIGYYLANRLCVWVLEAICQGIGIG